MSSAPLRTYGGVSGTDRQAERRAQLLEAGLDLLGSGDGPRALTVRGACRHAGLAARYFYENFADRDALAVAVYDRVVEGIAAATLDAVEQAAADAEAKVRAGLSRLVRAAAEDPRRGRLLFSPSMADTALAERRVASTRMFVELLGVQAREFYGVDGGTRLDILAEMLVGGLAQTLTSWLDGSLEATEDEIVDHCAELFLAASATS
ncbi:AcrR family transcriptional regulator [Prauserella isguenensis]|uniref:AcrR family transcriptional regulator n=1 Tax=Prauserella isguenensis TaxID=1470180 RepID=A0A839S1F0_9PSEU|nr:TetR/AcrR family transcriptional regulator [Prauserella isguenensis]MBB3051134.1 AcrR family transcriptional regulator [Prauserella isguenensis]